MLRPRLNLSAVLLLAGTTLLPATTSMHAQLDPLSHRAPANSPLTQPTLSPGVLKLMQLDAEFSQATANGGGKAFASWFTDDALALNNGKPPVLGKTRIAADANWDAKQYRLEWQPAGGQMGPSGDMGFTWGHYDGHSKDRNGNDVVTGGRYITVWRLLSNGTWKVAMDASANEPPAAGDCCALPKP
ncbi:MAG: YybH family protein [Janthinobacterium lividum]